MANYHRMSAAFDATPGVPDWDAEADLDAAAGPKRQNLGRAIHTPLFSPARGAD